MIILRAFHSGLTEYRCDHAEDCKIGEENVEKEQRNLYDGYIPERSDQLMPTNAICDGHEETEHGIK